MRKASATDLHSASRRGFSRLCCLSVTTVLCTGLLLPLHSWALPDGTQQQHIIPILGLTRERGAAPTGTVAHVVIAFGKRTDHNGLTLQFRSSPGRFSHLAQTSIEQAIRRSAHVLGLSIDSWTIVLSVPYPGLTVYGESLSAMVALSAAALAKGDEILPDHVMTGFVTPEGQIGPVGGVPLKVTAGMQAHMRRILVPDEQDVADADWTTPFLIQVSPVRSVQEAYQALTETVSADSR
jgi:hypothetical protein